ncbi:MAG: hypothetical protein IT449_12440 [Phycisphaerales bacterium]|nr:hypothetical protein [Phycisphaerales bacterium]
MLLLLLCVAGLATAVMATDYTWIGAQNDCSLPYYDAAYWSPDPGWPNCCDDEAFVSDVCDDEDSVIEMTVSGLSGAGIEQLTINEGPNEHAGQAVVFQNVDPYSGYPVLKCEVYVVDATNAEDNDVTVQAASYAMIQTVNTCICSN